MNVRFWGTRGSIASPGPATTKYGGNTSCVEVRTADGTLIVLDCGTGARALGQHLLDTADGPLRVHLFIGHTHWDHIQGFPFFVPAFLEGTELNIYAPFGFQRGLEEAMSGQMEYAYFPVKLRDLRSRIHFTELDEGFFRVGDALVETQHLNHTAPTIAYRITSGGVTVAYVTDHEPFWNPAGRLSDHPGDQRHVAFLRGADLVIHDAQYTDEEYREKTGWGHGTVGYATDVAVAAGVRRLALFHHDPAHDDAMVERLEAWARARAAAAGGTLEVFAAAEGSALEIRDGGGAPAVAAASATERRPLHGARVLAVTANLQESAAIQEVLAADELTLLTTTDAQTALARAVDFQPDLAIIDTALPDGDGAALADPLRVAVGRPKLPVVLLVDSAGAERINRGVAPTADDYLAKPFSPPMLHGRVRAWLARTLTAEERRARLAERSDPAPLAGPAEMLARVPLFRALPRPELEELASHGFERVFSAGDVVIDEGETPDRVYVVISGRVRVIEAMYDVNMDVVLGELSEGELFGELGVLTERPRSATVLAVERTRCLAFRQADFLATLQRSGELALALVRMLARRLYDSDRRLARYAPDALTGLASRRAFHDLYRRLAVGARRRKTGVVVLLFDVENLRSINDRYGYTIGDEVLRAVGDALMEVTRTADLVARYGPDEFAVMLPDAGLRDFDQVMPRVAAKLREVSARRGLGLTPQCRVGVAFRDIPPDSADELLREADQDLRRSGRRIPQ